MRSAPLSVVPIFIGPMKSTHVGPLPHHHRSKRSEAKTTEQYREQAKDQPEDDPGGNRGDGPFDHEDDDGPKRHFDIDDDDFSFGHDGLPL